MRSTLRNIRKRILSNSDASKPKDTKPEIVHPHLHDESLQEGAGSIAEKAEKESKAETSRKKEVKPKKGGDRRKIYEVEENGQEAIPNEPANGSDTGRHTAAENHAVTEKKRRQKFGIFGRSAHAFQFSTIGSDSSTISKETSFELIRPKSMEVLNTSNSSLSVIPTVRKSLRACRRSEGDMSIAVVDITPSKEFEEEDAVRIKDDIQRPKEELLGAKSIFKDNDQPDGVTSISIGSDMNKENKDAETDMNDIAANVSRLRNKAAYDKIALRPKRRPARNARGVRQQHVIRVETQVNGFSEEQLKENEEEVDGPTNDLSPPEPKRSRPPSRTLELSNHQDSERQSSTDGASASAKRFSMLGRSPIGPGPGMIVPSLQDVQKIKLKKRQPDGSETETSAKIVENKPKSTPDKTEKPKQTKKPNEAKRKPTKQGQKDTSEGGVSSVFTWKKSSNTKAVSAELSPETTKESEKPKGFFSGLKAGKKSSQDKESKALAATKASSEKKEASAKKGVLSRKREKNRSENNSNAFPAEAKKDDQEGQGDSRKTVTSPEPQPESPDFKAESIFSEDNEGSLMQQISAVMSQRYQKPEVERENKYSATLKQDAEYLAGNRHADKASKSSTIDTSRKEMSNVDTTDEKKGNKRGKALLTEEADAENKTLNLGSMSTYATPVARGSRTPTSPSANEKSVMFTLEKKPEKEKEPEKEEIKPAVSLEENLKSSVKIEQDPINFPHDKPDIEINSPVDTVNSISSGKPERPDSEDASQSKTSGDEPSFTSSAPTVSSPTTRPRSLGQKLATQEKSADEPQSVVTSPSKSSEPQGGATTGMKASSPESPAADILSSSVKSKSTSPYVRAEVEVIKTVNDKTKTSGEHLEKHENVSRHAESKDKLPQQSHDLQESKRDMKPRAVQTAAPSDSDIFHDNASNESKVAVPRIRASSAKAADEHAAEGLYSRNKLKHVGDNASAKRSASLKISPGSSSISVQRPKSFKITSGRTNREISTGNTSEATAVNPDATSSPSVKTTSPVKEKPRLPDKPRSPIKSPLRAPKIGSLMQDAENNNIKSSDPASHAQKESTKEIPERTKSGPDQTTAKRTRSRPREEEDANNRTPVWVQMARRRSKVWEDGDLKRQNVATRPQLTLRRDEAATRDADCKSKPKASNIESRCQGTVLNTEQPDETKSSNRTNSTEEREKKENRPQLCSTTTRPRVKSTEMKIGKNSDPSKSVIEKPKTVYVGAASKSVAVPENTSIRVQTLQVQSNRTASIPKISTTSQRKGEPSPTKVANSSSQPSWLAIAMQKQKNWSKEETV